MFVNITSSTQLQDGTTHDSTSIIYHIYMKSTKNYNISILNLFTEHVDKSARGKTNVQEKKTDLCYHTVYVI